MQHELDVRQGLEARAEARLRLANPLRDSADASARERIEVENPVRLAEAERAQHDGFGLVSASGHGPGQSSFGGGGNPSADFCVTPSDGESPRLQHALVRLLRPSEGAARLARDRVRGDLARRRSSFPAEALRPDRRLDGASDPHRRPTDRGLYGALAARPRGPARRTTRRLNLTPRAVPGAAAGDADLLDRRAAAPTRFALAAVDAEAFLRTAAPA